jgi:hypothetical protein
MRNASVSVPATFVEKVSALLVEADGLSVIELITALVVDPLPQTMAPLDVGEVAVPPLAFPRIRITSA